MSLKIDINIGVKPTPKIDKPAEVIKQAREAGSSNPNKALAVKRCFYVKGDLIKDLYVDTRPQKPQKPTEFRFSPDSVMRLSLVHKIYIRNTLSKCARGIVEQHEQDHVRDNQSLSFRRQLERKIRSLKDLQYIFFKPQWYLRSSAKVINRRIATAVDDVFNTLTRDMASKRDTPAEYARVFRKILKDRPGPFYHEVVSGESLSKIALFYYGNYRSWKLIYDNKENRRKIGSDPDYITPGKRLLIPKNP
jgi:nucleoid-associated protein YgaU